MNRANRFPNVADQELKPRRLGALVASVLIVALIGAIGVMSQDAAAAEAAAAFPADCKQLPAPVDCLYY